MCNIIIGMSNGIREYGTPLGLRGLIDRRMCLHVNLPCSNAGGHPFKIRNEVGVDLMSKKISFGINLLLPPLQVQGCRQSVRCCT